MTERSRTEYSILNITAGIGGYIINTIVGFVCRMIFVRCLSADYLGVNGLFTNVLSFLSFAELGIGSAIVYALYQPLANHDEDKIASLMKIYAKAYRIIGIIVFTVGLLLMPFINVIIQNQPNIKESIYLLYFLNLFNTASTYFFIYRASLIIAAQMNYIISGVNYIITILQSIIQIILLFATKNYLVYLLIQTIGIFIYNVIVSKIAIKKFPYIENDNIKELPESEKKSLFKNVRDLLMYKISSLLVNSTDNILITFFDGLTITGISSNYTLLINTLNSLLGQLFNGLTASVGNHNAKETVEKRFELFSFLNMMNFWIFGWATLGIIFCSSDLVELFFGKDYVLNISIPIVMATNFYLVGMQNAIWTYKHTLGLFRYGRFLQIFTGLINLVTSIILGNEYGLIGILFATVISRILTSSWYDPYVVYLHGFNKKPVEYLKKFMYYLFILGIAAILCYLSFSLINGSILYRVIAKIIFCSLITNTVFFLFLHKSKEFNKLKEIVGAIYNKYILKRIL